MTSVSVFVHLGRMASSDMLGNPTKHRVHHLNGFPVPFFVTQHRLDSLKEMDLFPDDIWVVTYPKCGTTWYGVPFVSKFRLGSMVLLGAETQFGVDVILAETEC